MRQNAVWPSLLVIVLLLAGAPASSAQGGEIGVRGAVADWHSEEDFDAYDLFLNVPLPWSWEKETGWVTSTQLHLSVGALKAAGETGTVATVVPAIAWSKRDFAFDIGAGFALLDQERFGRQDFGGGFQFAVQSGARYYVYRDLGVGLRVRHISDADTQDGHDLNQLLVEVLYRM